MTFGISIVLSLFCSIYYFTDKFVIEGFAARHNFLYCASFFVGGGVTYLNVKTVKGFVSRHKWVWLATCVGLSIAWYLVPDDDAGLSMSKNLVLFLPWLMYAISVNSIILNNRVMKFLSGISLELYLAQMVIFRVIEKMRGLYLLGHGLIGFFVAWVIIVVGLIVFIAIWKRLWALAQKQLERNNGS